MKLFFSAKIYCRPRTGSPSFNYYYYRLLKNILLIIILAKICINLV
jgi:hypothetical protein